MNNVSYSRGFVTALDGRASTRLTRKRLKCHRVPKSYDALEDGRAYTSELWQQRRPAILVGHSTVEGDHSSRKRSEVTGLVYITAFAPDKGESVAHS